MLDFYLIKDEQPKPAYPEQVGLEFVGGLNEATFYNLQNKGVIDTRFDFYSDFRLGTILIKQIRSTIDKRNLKPDSDVKTLLDLFGKADNNHCGLIAYGD